MPTRSTITFEESVVERKESAATVLGALEISGHLPPNTPLVGSTSMHLVEVKCDV